MRTYFTLRLLPWLSLLLAVACGAPVHHIRGTEVDDTADNRELIRVLERYRHAVEAKDAPALVLMASKDYWEDSGTPTGEDDYGVDGLERVLAGRFRQSGNIRYSIRYLRIRRTGRRAFVEGHVYASWTIDDAQGREVRHDKKGQEQWVLQREDDGWKFLSGM